VSRALAAAAAAGALGALLWACNPCSRDTSADGVYALLTDCAGTGLVRGTVQIGAFAADPAPSCEPDAGVHAVASPGDAGAPSAPGTCAAAQPLEAACAETIASGASRLGLPSHVRVQGDQEFELYGQVGGDALDCSRTQFGDEALLLCRSGGQVVCVAVINPSP
jgi:hypothetical protein